jgi:hypothetical protein
MRKFTKEAVPLDVPVSSAPVAAEPAGWVRLNDAGHDQELVEDYDVHRPSHTLVLCNTRSTATMVARQVCLASGLSENKDSEAAREEGKPVRPYTVLSSFNAVLNAWKDMHPSSALVTMRDIRQGKKLSEFPVVVEALTDSAATCLTSSFTYLSKRDTHGTVHVHGFIPVWPDEIQRVVVAEPFSRTHLLEAFRRLGREGDNPNPDAAVLGAGHAWVWNRNDPLGHAGRPLLLPRGSKTIVREIATGATVLPTPPPTPIVAGVAQVNSAQTPEPATIPQTEHGSTSRANWPQLCVRTTIAPEKTAEQVEEALTKFLSNPLLQAMHERDRDADKGGAGTQNASTCFHLRVKPSRFDLFGVLLLNAVVALKQAGLIVRCAVEL